MSVTGNRDSQPVSRAVVLLLVGMVPFLAACSAEPSESEMKGLVETHTRSLLTSQGQGAFPGFASFRKQGCVVPKLRNAAAGPSSTGDDLFDCYYAATFADTPARAGVTVNGKGRFTSTEKGFRYQDLGAQPR